MAQGESEYDAGKRECQGLLKALKKVRSYLYGVQFVIKVDARTLVHQLKNVAADVPGALSSCWLEWIRLFDFDVRSVTVKKHLVAECLLCRTWTLEDDNKSESEVKNFLDAQVFCLGVHSY